MPRLFTVTWPAFTRIEAALALPVTCLLALRGAAGLPPLVNQTPAMWGQAAVLTAVPYLAALMAVDRLLSVRRGFAILSILATAFWAGAAGALGPELPGVLPLAVAERVGGIPAVQHAALVVAAISLLIHARPLRLGLLDRGFIALRLAVHSHSARPHGAMPNPRDRRVRSLRYSRQILGWGSLAAILVNLYVYRFPLAAAGSLLVRSTLGRAGASAQPPARDADGLLMVMATANGVALRVVLDPAASAVILRAEDAERIGIAPAAGDFSAYLKVSNALVAVAAARINQLTVGGISQANVFAYVAKPGDLNITRVGKSFAVSD